MMKHLKITVACAGGMSSSMICNKIIAAAAKKGYECECKAYGTSEVGKAIEGSAVLLIGPQVAFQKEKLQQQYPTPMLQGWAFLMGGTMFALIFRPWTMNYVPTAMGVFGIFTVVVLGNVLAFSLYMSGVPLIGPQRSSLYSFAEPVTAAIISTLVLGSPFTVWDAMGFGCIFLMLVLLSLPAKAKN